VATAPGPEPLTLCTPPLLTVGVASQLLDWQLAGEPVHCPSTPQVRLALPVSEKPPSQPKLRVAPSVVPVPVMVPLAGAVSGPQSTGAHVGGAFVHVPAVEQVDDAAPVRT